MQPDPAASGAPADARPVPSRRGSPAERSGAGGAEASAAGSAGPGEHREGRGGSTHRAGRCRRAQRRALRTRRERSGGPSPALPASPRGSRRHSAARRPARRLLPADRTTARRRRGGEHKTPGGGRGAQAGSRCPPPVPIRADPPCGAVLCRAAGGRPRAMSFPSPYPSAPLPLCSRRGGRVQRGAGAGRCSGCGAGGGGSRWPRVRVPQPALGPPGAAEQPIAPCLNQIPPNCSRRSYPQTALVRPRQAAEFPGERRPGAGHPARGCTPGPRAETAPLPLFLSGSNRPVGFSIWCLIAPHTYEDENKFL